MIEYRFADRGALQFLALIPVILFLTWWVARRTRAVIESRISPRLTGFLTQSVSRPRRRLKLGLRALALFFFVIALARPQSGEGRQKAKREGLELMLMVDVSNSMLTEDARPSRLELAKKELTRFIDALGGDKIGIVAFAGSAILVSPMTNDKGALKMYLDSLSTDSVSTQGTDFKRALNEAFTALQRGGIEGDENRHVTRVIVVASDGEENERGGLEAARKIAEQGVRVYTLGFGTAQGGQIPMRDREGRFDRATSARRTASRSCRSRRARRCKALAEAGQGRPTAR